MVRGDQSTSNRTKPFAGERFAFNSADTTPSNLGLDSDHEFLARLFGIPRRVDTLALGVVGDCERPRGSEPPIVLAEAVA